MTITERRFWEKVRKGTDDECWVWTASKRSKGYGAFVYPRDDQVVQGRAHRYSWELHMGPIPAGLCVLHSCDNPACVNPGHLFLGTRADNNRDMRDKGRAVPGGTHCGVGGGFYERGEAHHNAKLTDTIVLAICADRELGLSFSQLAKKYNISGSHAYRVASGKLWKHVKRGGKGA